MKSTSFPFPGDKFQDPHQAAVLGIQMAVVVINVSL